MADHATIDNAELQLAALTKILAQLQRRKESVAKASSTTVDIGATTSDVPLTPTKEHAGEAEIVAASTSELRLTREIWKQLPAYLEKHDHWLFAEYVDFMRYELHTQPKVHLFI